MCATIHQRFWNKVIIKSKSDCWEWQGYTTNSGYGSITILGKTYTAHRLGYQLFYDLIIPADKVACHTCDNRSCVNPHHIFIGTPLDNVKDKMAKNRQAQGVHHMLATIGISKKSSKTGITGVWLCKKNGKYESQLTFKGKKVFWGYFDTIEDASAAYQDALQKIRNSGY